MKKKEDENNYTHKPNFLRNDIPFNKSKKKWVNQIRTKIAAAPLPLNGQISLFQRTLKLIKTIYTLSLFNIRMHITRISINWKSTYDHSNFRFLSMAVKESGSNRSQNLEIKQLRRWEWVHNYKYVWWKIVFASINTRLNRLNAQYETFNSV